MIANTTLTLHQTKKGLPTVTELKKVESNTFKTAIVINRYCLPSNEALEDKALKEFKDRYYNQFHADTFSDYISDFISVWYVLAISVGVAFVLGFIYLVILKLCAGFLLFLSMVLILIIIAGGGYWAYHTKEEYDETDTTH